MATDGPAGGDWAAPTPAPPPPGWAVEQPPPAPPPPPGVGYGWSPYGARAPKPGIVALRPLGVGELLDGAFTTIRRYPRATLGLAAVVMLFVAAADVATRWSLLHGVEPPAGTADFTGSSYFERTQTAAVITVVVTWFAVLVLTGLVTVVVGEGVIGRPMTPAAAWRRLRPVLARLVGTSVLVFLIVVGAVLACLLPGILLALAGAGGFAIFLLVVGGIGGVAVALWLGTSLEFAPAVVVLERQPIRVALRRSRLLVRGSWWRVFGIVLLAELIAGAVGFVLQVPFLLASGGIQLTQPTEAISFSQLVITAAGGLVAGTVVRPFQGGVIALLYIDRRIRAEALDLELTRAAAEVPPA